MPVTAGRVRCPFCIKLSMLLLAGLAVGRTSVGEQKPPVERERHRVFIQSDAERDDQNSLCRFLLYTNEFDVLGIVYNTTGGGAYDQWAVDRIKAYDKIRRNLVAHADGWPTAGRLLKRLHRHDEAGIEDKVIDLLLDDDPRPVWYLIWGPGGELTIGEVMRALKERSESEIDQALGKLRLFSIWSQSLTPCCGEDATQPWFPGRVFTINSRNQFKALAYRNDWANPIDAADAGFLSDAFQRRHFEQHGPLSDWYHGTAKGRPRTLEGDSPSFMHLLPVGLRGSEHPTYGGWGGRFAKSPNDPMLYAGATDSDGNEESRLYKPISRWFHGSQNDYAARCDWAVTPEYEKANHEPVAHLEHEEDLEVIAGSTVALSARGSWDPDGDPLVIRWWRYRDADTYPGEVEVRRTGPLTAEALIPEDAGGSTVHMILEVQDEGAPALTRYRRVILSVLAKTP